MVKFSNDDVPFRNTTHLSKKNVVAGFWPNAKKRNGYPRSAQDLCVVARGTKTHFNIIIQYMLNRWRRLTNVQVFLVGENNRKQKQVPTEAQKLYQMQHITTTTGMPHPRLNHQHVQRTCSWHNADPKNVNGLGYPPAWSTYV